jgi:general secretion pathway protein D
MRAKKIRSAGIVVFTALMLGSLSSVAWTSTPQQPTPVAPAGQKDSSKLMLGYENAALHEFIDAMAAHLGLTPIIIDPEVEGKVTVKTSSPMSKEDALSLFHTILKNNNAALVKQGDQYRVVSIATPAK